MEDWETKAENWYVKISEIFLELDTDKTIEEMKEIVENLSECEQGMEEIYHTYHLSELDFNKVTNETGVETEQDLEITIRLNKFEETLSEIKEIIGALQRCITERSSEQEIIEDNSEKEIFEESSVAPVEELPLIEIEKPKEKEEQNQVAEPVMVGHETSHDPLSNLPEFFDPAIIQAVANKSFGQQEDDKKQDLEEPKIPEEFLKKGREVVKSREHITNPITVTIDYEKNTGAIFTQIETALGIHEKENSVKVSAKDKSESNEYKELEM